MWEYKGEKKDEMIIPPIKNVCDAIKLLARGFNQAT
jgi:hypothetical protein